MSYVFISYSKLNREYANTFKAKLLGEGFNVWMDDAIEPSEDWWRNIRQAIKECAVFAIIMTPESETSHWVGLELLHALEYKKPLFPLLRDGDSNLLNSDMWSRIANIQYIDVRHGRMPLDSFYVKLAEYIPKSPLGREIISNRLLRKPTSISIIDIADAINEKLPPPFDLCEIQSGWVTLRDASKIDPPGTPSDTFQVPTFLMAKYPITNAQYNRFILEAHNQVELWDYSTESLEWRHQNPQPMHSAFEGDRFPRTNVSWYDTIAFCRWLSNSNSQMIMLPSEQQWQLAAQGNDDRIYPWGKEFDQQKSNFNSRRVTPVDKYVNGASSFGVMDMSGNVWEWCLNQWGTHNLELHSVTGNAMRALRGGSWKSKNASNLRVFYRGANSPKTISNSVGFRIVVSI